MNPDGSENNNYSIPLPIHDKEVFTDIEEIKPVEMYKPRRIHQDCSCARCWRIFIVKAVFYFIIIYALYLLVSLAVS